MRTPARGQQEQVPSEIGQRESGLMGHFSDLGKFTHEVFVRKTAPVARVHSLLDALQDQFLEVMHLGTYFPVTAVGIQSVLC